MRAAAGDALALARRGMRWGAVCPGLVLAALLASCGLSPTVPDDEAIRAILAERIDHDRQAVGIVVGVVTPAGRRVVAYGQLGRDDPRPVGGDTVFEIGSITKVFTALLLADAVLRGDVALDDPVAGLLPGWRIPARGRPITLQDLAQHVSGLPREVPGIAVSAVASYIARFDAKAMRAFLAGYELPRDVGAEYEYSNLGAGLLGIALAARLAGGYDELVRTRVALPLGMADTAVMPTPAMAERLAQGHDVARNAVPPFASGAGFVAAGALRSTADDLLAFLAAAMGLEPSPLAPAFERMQATRAATGRPGFEAGLGWAISTADGRTTVWRNGGTPGFSAWIGFDPERRAGVVVLANTFAKVLPDAIGRHLLDPRDPLADLSPELLDRCVGIYRVTPEQPLTVHREGSRLLAQVAGFPAVPLVPESPTRFGTRGGSARFEFEIEPNGHAIAAVIRQGGRTLRAPRER